MILVAQVIGAALHSPSCDDTVIFNIASKTHLRERICRCWIWIKSIVAVRSLVWSHPRCFRPCRKRTERRRKRRKMPGRRTRRPSTVTCSQPSAQARPPSALSAIRLSTTKSASTAHVSLSLSPPPPSVSLSLSPSLPLSLLFFSFKLLFSSRSCCCCLSFLIHYFRSPHSILFSELRKAFFFFF